MGRVTETALPGPVLPAPPLPVRTQRLVLRTVRPEDAPDLAYYTDPEVCRYIPVGPLDHAELAARAARLAGNAAPSAPGEVLTLAVEHDGTVVGDLMLRLDHGAAPEQPPAIAEIGWVMAAAYGGRGLATEAAGALVDLAFGHYPLHRLHARLDPRNTASARLCERLGMTREGHLRRNHPERDGTWSDTAVYGLLREEWAARRG